MGHVLSTSGNWEKGKRKGGHSDFSSRVVDEGGGFGARHLTGLGQPIGRSRMSARRAASIVRVPEPQTLLCLMVGASWLLGRRRRTRS